MSVEKPKLVTHFIAGYPDTERSLDVARALIDGGAYALEMQIPYSDPNADGPVIEEACLRALNAGFKVSDAWKLIEAIRAESDIPLFVMSYAGLVVAPGIETFVKHARESGVTGLIVPDLVPGADEGLYETAAKLGCPAVPVIVPWVTAQRLDEILSVPSEWLYVALRSGITGTYTEIGEDQSAILKTLRERQASGGPKVMAGFGIQKAEQVQSLITMADAAIVGSALVKAIASLGDDSDLHAEISGMVKYLCRIPKGD